ncbi:MAG: epoxyqueuosine reductase [Clostridia bacterium]|nr:epoxyqueuosine reductase [Clostridia bacterium]
MINELELKQNLINMGADLVGFSNIKTSPILGQGDLTYAVTIAVKLSDAVLKTIEERPTISYFHEYRTANALLDSISFRLVRILEKEGYSAFPIPASQSTAEDKEAYKGLFQHKTAARLAGLGFIGKSGLFISKEYGSKIRLATVLTNAPLVSENAPLESLCKGCNKCVLACPAGAISGKEYVEGMQREDFFSAEKCSHNMKNYKDIGRGAVCGICIKVCPFNKLK